MLAILIPAPVSLYVNNDGPSEQSEDTHLVTASGLFIGP